MQKSYRYALILALSFAACKTPAPVTTATTTTTAGKDGKEPLLPYGPAWAALWQQRSSEYKALCFQAYNTAIFRLDQILQQGHDKPLAVVTDIDETVLDNSPYTVHRSMQGLGYSNDSWKQWTDQADADTVPGALSFLKYASSKGVKVFYITNRLQAEQEATLSNLRHWGFPDADAEHLLLKTTTSGKESRRRQVLQSHEIALLMGDNLGDFSEIFDKQPAEERDEATRNAANNFGNRFIVLPNPMYGDWEGALYNYQHQLSPTEKEAILEKKLRNYKQ
ncbi:5'-nucleotidase, lipoprotein e(P4) family [Chitinophaga pendula]|uniref:5'-nucleotidase, lipoprotein e(P4) family n=1 Tax=Chitinophaga TaxID=79328 RepID=UPI000BAF3865|nr:MULTISPECIES: 5'-nucleotidase, lipoprotein e(P4) family [Chitinophaga]ASZ14683.1 5'-nucleotidase, lipoprotein e(P4) family [Chitinophaga sp. MD30]UCJ07661.1 5'-nucleotidase, lipoprotein e(P4) family [Chitinophaga pendula]